MLSMADSVDGQGVGSAYLELMKLLITQKKNQKALKENKKKKKELKN